jgi:uncharacterized phage-associated protein
MGQYTANQAADYFLSFCRKHGDYLTNLKLQKLVYYAQAWHLALKNKPLFIERIEAWAHGPVVPPLYGRFKKYGWSPISVEPACPTFSNGTGKFLEEVFSVYGHYSAWDLERMTHQEEPWRNARKGLSPDDEGHNVITHNDMRDFYRKLSGDRA